MRWMYEYHHDARTQSPRLTAARRQLAVGARELGPRDQEEQRTQRASFVATYHTRVHTEQQLNVLGSDALLKKYYMKHTSLRCQTRVSERRLGCLSPGPSGAAPDIAVVDVGFNFLSPNT